MKTMRIFLSDLKLHLRSLIPLWILINPLLLAVLITVTAPGITDSFLCLAMTRDVPVESIAFYRRYASVELFDNAEQVEKRVLARDACLGLELHGGGSPTIVAQGNEPTTMVDALKLLKTLQEEHVLETANVQFSDLGRREPPLKSILVTGLLTLVTILSGMLVSLGIVDEKRDRTIRAMKVAPVSTASFLLGKSLIGVAYTVVVGFAVLLISGYRNVNALQILLVLLTTALITVVIGFLVGLTSNDFIEAAGNMKIVMIPAVAPMLVTELADPKWHFLVWWSPFYWCYVAIKGLLLQTISTGQLMLYSGIVLLLTLALYFALLPKIKQKL